MTSDLDASAAQDAGSASRGGPAAPGPAVPGITGPAGAVSPRRRARAALLNASALMATTAAFAAFDAKLPRYVGD